MTNFVVNNWFGIIKKGSAVRILLHTRSRKELVDEEAGKLVLLDKIQGQHKIFLGN